MIRPLLVMVLLLGLLSVPSRAQSPAPTSTLDEAHAAFTEGARLISSDRAAAQRAFVRAADLYESVGRTSVFSGELMYNIGTMRTLGGDVGHGVLWLKRAERQMPNSAMVRANLMKARESAGAGAARGDSFLDQLSILEFIPARARFWTGVVALALMWALALVRLWAASWRPGRMLIGAAGVMGLLAGASLVPRELRVSEGSEAIVLVETTGRAGPDAAAYEARPAKPLKPGTEVRVIEERGSWLLVDLADGTRSWLEGKGVERVRLARS